MPPPTPSLREQLILPQGLPRPAPGRQEKVAAGLPSAHHQVDNRIAPTMEEARRSRRAPPRHRVSSNQVESRREDHIRSPQPQGGCCPADSACCRSDIRMGRGEVTQARRCLQGSPLPAVETVTEEAASNYQRREEVDLRLPPPVAPNQLLPAGRRAVGEAGKSPESFSPRRRSDSGKASR